MYFCKLSHFVVLALILIEEVEGSQAQSYSRNGVIHDVCFIMAHITVKKRYTSHEGLYNINPIHPNIKLHASGSYII